MRHDWRITKNTVSARRRNWRDWLGIALGIAILSALLAQVELTHLASSLGRCGVGYVAVAAIAAAVAAVPAAWAWKLLMDAQGFDLKFRRVQALYAVGLFFATFTPGGVGSDFVRIFHLHQTTRKGVEAAASVLAARLLSVTTLLVIVAGASLARAGVEAATTAALAGLAVLGSIASLLVVERLVGGRVVRGLPVPVTQAVFRVGACLGAFRHSPATLAWSCLLLAVYHLFAVLPLYVLARGLGADLALTDVLALGLLMHLVAFLPISPSGIGVYEVGVVVLFSTLGLSSADGLALSILARLTMLPVPVAGGIIYLAGRGGTWEADSRSAPAPMGVQVEEEAQHEAATQR